MSLLKHKLGSPFIYNTTLTLADTWYQIGIDLDTLGRILVWTLKPKESTDNEFDYAYENNPTSFMTNSGQGVTEEINIKQIWARSSISGTIMELQVFVER